MCLLRSHEMYGDSAEVAYQGIAVDQWLGRVSDVECDALAGKADAYCKVDVARRQTGCAERCQCLLYKTAEDLVLTISGLARYNVVAAIIREMAYNKCVAGQPEAEGRQHAHGRMTFWNLHVTVGRSARPHSVISHNDTLISLVSIIYLLTIPLYTLGIIF